MNNGSNTEQEEINLSEFTELYNNSEIETDPAIIAKRNTELRDKIQFTINSWSNRVYSQSGSQYAIVARERRESNINLLLSMLKQLEDSNGLSKRQIEIVENMAENARKWELANERKRAE
jgi:hypothetical protein